ncbi:ATP-binding protein [Stomatohabitans albus]|uniref:ATP-binding protein n=1 Tax=Stomatohabitans albus TaxID=3110766 RepID=UPI00300C9BE5
MKNAKKGSVVSLPMYPFSAIVGQEEMKLGLILSVLSPQLSGILIRGEKGTAKSTAVRGLAALLPDQIEIGHTAFHLTEEEYLQYGAALNLDADLTPVSVSCRVVDLPVGSTEDRVCGTIDVQAAIQEGKKQFEPGILASAHRALLYVDEVNLLDDHIVDVLLDAAAMGVHTVEREGISVTHPARFSLIGTMNPEEGELRPQLLDRFGMCVTVTGEHDPALRVEVIERRMAFEDNPDQFIAQWEEDDNALSEQIADAKARIADVVVEHVTLEMIAKTSLDANVDGHRADLMMMRAAIAIAAWLGHPKVEETDLHQAARLVLPHRIRRTPLEMVAT